MEIVCLVHLLLPLPDSSLDDVWLLSRLLILFLPACLVNPSFAASFLLLSPFQILLLPPFLLLLLPLLLFLPLLPLLPLLLLLPKAPHLQLILRAPVFVGLQLKLQSLAASSVQRQCQLAEDIQIL